MVQPSKRYFYVCQTYDMRRKFFVYYVNKKSISYLLHCLFIKKKWAIYWGLNLRSSSEQKKQYNTLNAHERLSLLWSCISVHFQVLLSLEKCYATVRGKHCEWKNKQESNGNVKLNYCAINSFKQTIKGASTHFICFTIVDFPDSPAPETNIKKRFKISKLRKKTFKLDRALTPKLFRFIPEW